MGEPKCVKNSSTVRCVVNRPFMNFGGPTILKNPVRLMARLGRSDNSSLGRSDTRRPVRSENRAVKPTLSRPHRYVSKRGSGANSES